MFIRILHRHNEKGFLSRLFFDLDFSHHSDVGMIQVGVCNRHLTVQHVTPWDGLFSEPDDPADIMTVKRAA
jgi:hypothetical protein